MSDLNLFPSRLKEARIKADISQKELSRRTGIAPATLSSYESTENFKNPTIDKVAAIADALNISIDWLCGIDVDKNKSNSLDSEIRKVLESIVTLIYECDVRYDKGIISLRGNSYYREFADAIYNLSSVHRSNPNAFSKELYETCVEKLICDCISKIKTDKKL